ncbi:MAG TPA: hypothetical protein VF323_01300 [Candidatus Limnocylindrales bacterium]
MDLFLLPINHPVPFWISAGAAGVMLIIWLRSASSAEGRASGWVRAITNPNARFLFAMLFVGWALVFGIGLQLVPHEGADSPYGGFALIALFTGFFIMMGLLWSVIGE